MRLPLAEVRLPDATHNAYPSRHLQHGEVEKLTQIQNRCFAGSWGYNPNAAEAANQMFEETFDKITLLAKKDSAWYNFLGIFGIGNRDSSDPNDFICSEFVHYYLKRAGVVLNGVIEDLRISPQEIWSTVQQWGQELTDLFGGG